MSGSGAWSPGHFSLLGKKVKLRALLDTGSPAGARYRLRSKRRDMAQIQFEREVPVRRQVAFELLVNHFRGLGFRLEEDDRMNFKLVMDRGSVLASIFGGAMGFRQVWLRAAVQRLSERRSKVLIAFEGRGKAVNDQARAAYEADLLHYEEACAEHAQQQVATSASEPAVIREVVIKEVVRIPCKYCGSLMENTARKCPDCGAPCSD